MRRPNALAKLAFAASPQTFSCMLLNVCDKDRDCIEMERRRRGTIDFAGAAPSALDFHSEADPGLTAGPIHCRPFGPPRNLETPEADFEIL